MMAEIRLVVSSGPAMAAPVLGGALSAHFFRLLNSNKQ